MERAVCRSSLRARAHAQLRGGTYAAAVVIHDDWRFAALSFFGHRFAAIDLREPNLLILTPRGQLLPLLLMIKILHYLKDPKLWELWYIPYYG